MLHVAVSQPVPDRERWALIGQWPAFAVVRVVQRSAVCAPRASCDQWSRPQAVRPCAMGRRWTDAHGGFCREVATMATTDRAAPTARRPAAPAGNRGRACAPVVDRLSGQDLSMLWPDKFGWPQDIGVIGVLDGTGLFDADGGLRIGRVRGAIASRLHLVPRLRQVVYRPRRGLGRPLWVDVESVDLANHVRVLSLPAPADDEQLLRACERLHQRQLDRSRPLWELWLLPGLPDGRVGLYIKLHHVVADGAAAVALLGTLLDTAPDPASPAAPGWTPRPVPPARLLLVDNLRRHGEALSTSGAQLIHPVRAVRRTRGGWHALRGMLAEHAPRTSLNRPVGPDRRIALVRSRLDVVQDVAHTADGTVNDVILAVIAGGLRDLLRQRGEHVEDVVLRAMVPISLHREAPGQAQGNLDGGMLAALPVGEPDIGRRLGLIIADTTLRKTQARRPAQTGIAGSTVIRKILLRLMDRQRLANVYIANVPGPPVPLYLAGARLLEVFPVVPLTGNLTLCVGVLSYSGQLNFAPIADPASCPDLPVFTGALQRSVADITHARPPRSGAGAISVGAGRGTGG
jgi:diacylglycerol O-acyltransferase / wax synthase